MTSHVPIGFAKNRKNELKTIKQSTDVDGFGTVKLPKIKGMRSQSAPNAPGPNSDGVFLTQKGAIQ